MLTRLRRSAFATLLALAALLPLSSPAHATSDIWDYDATTPGNNTNIGGNSMAEGMPPSAVNNGIRELISQVKRAVANQGADIASATTTAICATGTSAYAKVTGTTTITGFGTAAAGCWRLVTFTGALTLTHNATSLILPGAANITTAAGDAMVAVSEGSGNWRVLSYSRTPLIAPLSLSSTAAGTLQTLTSTDAGATSGPDLVLDRSGGAGTAADNLGAIKVKGRDSANNAETYVDLQGQISDPTNGSEDGTYYLGTMNAGTLSYWQWLSGGLFHLSATGGNKGAGTVNAVGVYVNGHGTSAQRVQATSATLQTSATTLPFDNTIPQNTEGGEFLSIAITPVNASSVLYIDVQTLVGGSATTTATCALFVDTTANALAAAGESLDATTVRTIKFTHAVSAASTSARTYKVRCGLNSGTVSLNGTNGTQVYGGVASSSIVVTEVLPQ